MILSRGRWYLASLEEHPPDVFVHRAEELHPPPAGGRKKRKASTHGEAEASKKGKTSLSDNSAAATNSNKEWVPRVKPLAGS